MAEVETKTIGQYTFFSNGKIYNHYGTETGNKLLHNKRVFYLPRHTEPIEVGKIIAKLFMDDANDLEYGDFDIDYLDGDFMNCAVENLKIVEPKGRPPEKLFLVHVGRCWYEELTRREIAKKFNKHRSFAFDKLQSKEEFLYEGKLYYITDDEGDLWDYM